MPFGIVNYRELFSDSLDQLTQLRARARSTEAKVTTAKAMIPESLVIIGSSEV
jgi:hypothetical protein